jgi:hypothetical protein
MMRHHTNAHHVKLLLSIKILSMRTGNSFMFNLYVLSICNTIGARGEKETALLRIDNAALLDMLK